MSNYTTLIRELSVSAKETAIIEYGKVPDHKGPSRKILAALRDGSHDAFDVVFNRYHAPLRKYLTAVLGSEDEAQEMTQEVFVKLWIRHEEIDPQKDIKWFLFSTARHLTRGYFRHLKVESKYEDFIKNAHNHYDLSADDGIMEREQLLLAEIALERMPPQRQKIFRMRFQDEKSNQEIATELGLSPHTVRSHLNVAKKEISEILAAFFVFFMIS